MAPLGHLPDESFHLTGHGVTVRYTQSYLKVTWENGSEVTMRSAGRRTAAHIDHIRVGADIVTLTLKTQITLPDPWFSHVDMVLAFPGSLAADVQRLADRLNTGREDGAPDARKPEFTPEPWAAHAPEPARRGSQAQSTPAELPSVTFRADLAAWAEDDEWIGLYPSFETTRLISDRPLRQSREASSSSPPPA